MRFDSLAAWLDWQAGLNPQAIDLGLERVERVWNALGRPAADAAVITVAGTNGKGSSVAFAEAILEAAGYRTGCYTSPHLQHYNERIRLGQTPVDDRQLCGVFDRIDRARGDVPLTYFEFGTLAALCLFAESDLDVVVLEVGLGGRLDAVNLVDPDVALITSIGLDHQDWLGADLEAIGAEKAGVMRRARPAVFSGRSMPRSIRSHAQQIGAGLSVAGEDYRVVRRPDGWDLLSGDRVRRALPQPAMRGVVQIDNAAGVLVALDCLSGRLPIDQRAVRAGLLSARLPGRFDVRPGSPTWVLDVAHNPQAATVLDALLADYFVRGRRIAVCGMLQDKDAAGVAQALCRRFDEWYLVDLSDQPRGMTSMQMAERVRPILGDTALTVAAGVDDTLAEVAAAARPDDLVVVFGSFLTVGAAMTWLESGARPAAKA
jgi:dihydrofolate synthase/folylpolyglutamate synthase